MRSSPFCQETAAVPPALLSRQKGKNAKPRCGFRFGRFAVAGRRSLRVRIHGHGPGEDRQGLKALLWRKLSMQNDTHSGVSDCAFSTSHHQFGDILAMERVFVIVMRLFFWLLVRSERL
jgi:hypothetical protein